MLFMEMAWIPSRSSVLRSGLGFHLVIALVCWLGSYMVDVLVFFFSGRYQEKLYEDWSQTVSEKSQYNLTQPLIWRDPETKLITVNFDPQVKTSTSQLSCLPAGMSPSCAPACTGGLVGLVQDLSC